MARRGRYAGTDRRAARAVDGSSRFRREADTHPSRLAGHALVMDEQPPVERDRSDEPGERAPDPWPGDGRLLDAPPSWIALPVGRAEDGPSIAELVAAVRAAGGMVGGTALFDPRYEPEMRRFLIRALEMEGIPVPRGGDTP